MFANKRDGALAVLGRVDLVAIPRKLGGKNAAKVRLVVNDENLLFTFEHGARRLHHSRFFIAYPAYSANTFRLVRRSLLLSALLLVAAPSLALTELALADPSPYEPCKKVPAQADLDAARGLHQAAKQYVAKALYERAIQSWFDAVTFDCTKPDVFINIGNAYERLGETGKAIVAYQTYIERKGAAANPDILEKVQNLKLMLEKNERDAHAATLPTNRNGNPPTGPDPGPAQDDSGNPNGAAIPWPLIVTGTGGALALIGAIFLGVGSSKVAEAEVLCPDRKCAIGGAESTGAEDQAKRDALETGQQGVTFERGGGFFIGLGLATAGGGLAWHFLTEPDTSVKSQTPEPKSAWRVVPEIGWGYYGASSRVAF